MELVFCVALCFVGRCAGCGGVGGQHRESGHLSARGVVVVVRLSKPRAAAAGDSVCVWRGAGGRGVGNEWSELGLERVGVMLLIFR